MKSIYWVRNDLRWQDNQTLIHFSSLSRVGFFVWCITPTFLRAGPIRKQFIVESLLEFRKKVIEHGGLFLISKQSALNTLPELINKNKFDAVFFTKEMTTEETNEEIQLVSQLKIQFFPIDQTTLIHERDLPFTISDIPEQFTQFRIKVEKNLLVESPLPVPLKIPLWAEKNQDFQEFQSGFELDSAAPKNLQITGGESYGLARLDHFFWKSNRIQSYKNTRNGLLDWDDSSKLSPWLAVGALSARQIYQTIHQYEQKVMKNESTYWLFFELLWRDYFKFISLKWGSKFFTGMNQNRPNGIITKDDHHRFAMWSQGRTGNDFIDANMTELNQTGWMSNRGRQNVASYLTKILNVDWRWGARYFEVMLIDYDATANWGNWAYLGGVGQDPRDRVFNIEKQAATYDPDGHYRQKFKSPA